MSGGIVYRPYPWQKTQWALLAGLASQQRLPHAMLLKGPADTGKLRFALAFAHWLLCAQPSDEGACGVCGNCQLLLAETHPDIKLVNLRDGKKQIVIEQVRELVDFCSRTAHREGGHKIAIISPAENMNLQTANALLKTLEEPAGDTLLVLVCHAPSLLPATIRSRCFSVSFPLPPRETSLAWLKTFAEAETDDQRLLDEAGGKPLAVAKLLESDTLQSRANFDGIIANLAGGKVTALMAAEQFLQADIDMVLEWLVLRLHMLAKSRTLDQGAEALSVWGTWAQISTRDVFKLLDKTLDTRSCAQRGIAINQRLVFESLLLDWQSCARNAQLPVGAGIA